jgi:hypothetical protein
MAVHSCAGHVQHRRNLRDRILSGVVQPLSKCDLIIGELRWAAALSAARPRSGQAVPSVRHNQLTLKFREYRQHPEHRPTFGGGGIDSLLEDFQPDPPPTQIGTERDQMQNRPAQPVEAGDHQRVTVAHSLQNSIQLWP